MYNRVVKSFITHLASTWNHLLHICLSKLITKSKTLNVLTWITKGLLNSTIDIILIFSNTIFIRLLHSFQSPLFSLFTVSNLQKPYPFYLHLPGMFDFLFSVFIAALFFEEQTASNSCYVEYIESIFVCVWIRMRPETQAKFYLNWVNSRFVTTKTKTATLFPRKQHKRI